MGVSGGKLSKAAICLSFDLNLISRPKCHDNNRVDNHTIVAGINTLAELTRNHAARTNSQCSIAGQLEGH